MVHFITFIFVLVLSYQTHAQVEFGALIEDSITQQNNSATDLQKSVKTASSAEDDSFDDKTLNSTAPAAQSAVPTQATGLDEQEMAQNKVKDAAQEKDFNVHLRQTGRESAARYFPYQPRTSKKLSRNKIKGKKGKIATLNNKAKKKTPRGTASVKTKPVSKLKKKVQHKK